MRRFALTSLGIVAAMLLAVPAIAAPPTAEEMAAMDEKIGEWLEARRAEGMERREIMEGMAAYADELLGDVDYTTLTGEEIITMKAMRVTQPDNLGFNPTSFIAPPDEFQTTPTRIRQIIANRPDDA